MKVVKVAETALSWNDDPELNLCESGYKPLTSDWDDYETCPDKLAEAAGRLCYQSFHRPNPKTATNGGYLANILKQKHFSILEHSSVTFYVEGVSRAMLLELERHRFLSFSVVSQRYVDHSESEVIVPPVLEPHLDEVMYEVDDRAFFPTVRESLDEVSFITKDVYTDIVSFLERKGYSRKESRGAARAVLPEGTETKFFVTGNLRAWRDIIEKRNSPHADQEIREFAQEVLKHLKVYAPNSMQDMEL